MRTATATKIKGGGGWYNDDAVNGKKCDEEGKEEAGDDHIGEEK